MLEVQRAAADLLALYDKNPDQHSRPGFRHQQTRRFLDPEWRGDDPLRPEPALRPVATSAALDMPGDARQKSRVRVHSRSHTQINHLGAGSCGA